MEGSPGTLALDKARVAKVGYPDLERRAAPWSSECRGGRLCSSPFDTGISPATHQFLPCGTNPCGHNRIERDIQDKREEDRACVVESSPIGLRQVAAGRHQRFSDP